MHPTTLSILADHRIAEYRREAADQRLASMARRAAGVTSVAPTTDGGRRHRIASRALQPSDADF
jgi:hypothetical protein